MTASDNHQEQFVERLRTIGILHEAQPAYHQLAILMDLYSYATNGSALVVLYVPELNVYRVRELIPSNEK